MAYNTKEILKDKDLNPISQYYNPTLDKYEAVEGASGGNKVVLYNEDGTENNGLSLLPILDKLTQLTGTVIDENTRKTNEIDRKAKEVTRESNESTRKSNETTRKSNETARGTAESTRVSQENTRKSNEVSRISNMDIVQGWINNPSQFNGKDIEYNWNGTELGIRVAGQPTYSYVDLKGDTGSIDSLTAGHITGALGYTPLDEIFKVTKLSQLEIDVPVGGEEGTLLRNFDLGDEVAPVTSIDADRLGGELPSAYAKTSDLTVYAKASDIKQQIILTQSEYDILSQEEKDDPNKIYFIKVE